jgi:hypothetical protein
MKIAQILEAKPTAADKKLMSLLVFLRSRADQTGAKPQISMNGLIQMAQSVGIPLSYESFSALVQSNPNFNNLVQDFNKDQVILNLTTGDDATIAGPGDLDIEPTDAVDKMAKRALRKRS